MRLRRPCSTCPWRLDAPRGHWHPEHFVSIYRNCQDDGINIMRCHKSVDAPEDKQPELVCQGWIRVMGFGSIGVRLAVLNRRCSKDEILDRGGPALFPSFEAMMRANRVPLPPRNQVVPIRRRTAMPAGDEHLGKFVYCHSHRTPHSTGWCTVPVDSPTCTGAQGTASKIGLKAQTLEEAFAEVRAMGLPIYGEIKESP